MGHLIPSMNNYGSSAAALVPAVNNMALGGSPGYSRHYLDVIFFIGFQLHLSTITTDPVLTIQKNR